MSAGDFNSAGWMEKSIKIIGTGGFNSDKSKNTAIQQISIRRPDIYSGYIV
ncbi:hypothetical protein FACS1894177_02890 [Bacteroidia bacterium]|nr:hypothetical protein FACS1894177_02890 [Bacteroidia bacterium]